ncbi:(-)-isopiperitenol/(-)-carveol dehydrogenase [Spatholobus suberectus]|nr:(-)-isopiperitenol/(-)-carveol dehydrogenase [Spatholobus suberectus]
MAESTSTTTTNSGLRLTTKVAIVNGGASGIGEATARVFAEQGARMVVIADIQDELGNQVAASIGRHRCTYVHCNVADEDQVQNLVQSTVNAYGQVDVMFSNAGIASPAKQTVPELDMAQLDRLFAVNVREARRACHVGEARERKHSVHRERRCQPRWPKRDRLHHVEARGVGVDAFGECATCGTRDKGELRLTQWVGNAVDL